MWSLLHNPSAYPSARTRTSSVVGSCFTYKLGMLPVLRFQAELSPSFLWKFTEFRAETPPPCLWNSKLRYPPTSSEFQSKKLPLSLGIPRCRPWYGMDIFWNHPLYIYNAVIYATATKDLSQTLFSKEQKFILLIEDDIHFIHTCTKEANELSNKYIIAHVHSVSRHPL